MCLACTSGEEYFLKHNIQTLMAFICVHYYIGKLNFFMNQLCELVWGKKKLMGLPTWVLDFVFIPFILIYISVYMALRTLKAPFYEHSV